MIAYQQDLPVELSPVGVLTVSEWRGGWFVNALYVEPVPGSRVYIIRVSGPFGTHGEASDAARAIQGIGDSPQSFRAGRM